MIFSILKDYRDNWCTSLQVDDSFIHIFIFDSRVNSESYIQSTVISVKVKQLMD